jgi:hypothetical protein
LFFTFSYHRIQQTELYYLLFMSLESISNVG